VVAITAVDSRGRALPEAGKANHLDFAAPGSPAKLAGEARPGRGRVGRGIVCEECRIEPRAVNAK
jgi:hypothetical protein